VIGSLLGLVALAAYPPAPGDLQFANIGDLKLQSGQTLRDCRVGYRVFGLLDAAKDNVVLWPTWYLGTSADLAGNIRPGGPADPTKFCVIAVDALTNGVSTSPSNSKLQHDSAFPTVGIRDMVKSQHSMLEKMGITHLRAVMGISMGGIQAFQWITAYPDFMDEAIPIVGSPRPSSYDLMFYTAGIKALTAAIKKPDAREDLIRTYGDYFMLALNTPTFYASHTKRDGAVANMDGFSQGLLRWDPYDMLTGLQAVTDQDIFKPFGEDEAKAAAAVHAKLFVISASQDHCVNPAPALEFAGLLGAATMVLDDPEGHSSPGAEWAKVNPAVEKFLETR